MAANRKLNERFFVWPKSGCLIVMVVMLCSSLLTIHLTGESTADLRLKFSELGTMFLLVTEVPGT